MLFKLLVEGASLSSDGLSDEEGIVGRTVSLVSLPPTFAVASSISAGEVSPLSSTTIATSSLLSSLSSSPSS